MQTQPSPLTTNIFLLFSSASALLQTRANFSLLSLFSSLPASHGAFLDHYMSQSPGWPTSGAAFIVKVTSVGRAFLKVTVFLFPYNNPRALSLSLCILATDVTDYFSSRMLHFINGFPSQQRCFLVPLASAALDPRRHEKRGRESQPKEAVIVVVV